MKKLPRQCLLKYENLTLPGFQVVVMAANVGCVRCQERVSQVISKMDGVHEYTVDIRNKQVIVKGDFKVRHESVGHQIRKEEEHQFQHFFRYFRISFLSKHLGSLNCMTRHHVLYTQ
ncbi:uncharacterized protein LOC115737049 [Rhodamnia argentea]|uniref:Uncharacterized protein LOC115737049 n=1 Tax=Rhodamnia argentea TaxID=178133 RepID=A0A8B8NQS0_9MYRT|nr:uncharacterized protein LOC115737049 [Rhodamnia argentea]